jgi:DNA polymerase III subunit epsilon
MYDFSKEVLILDCQTTGTHPKNSHLLQIGWSVINPMVLQPALIEKCILKLPDDYKIPSNIIKMQQISDDDLQQALEPNCVFDKLQQIIKTMGENPIVIAHYAQFEKSFLRSFYLEHAKTEHLNFELLCSQRIAKRLLPNLPSHNLKAIAGYLKNNQTPKNEVTSHVSMTIEVWRHLVSKCLELNIMDYQRLKEWLNTKHQSIKPSFYDYNIEKATRLNLSNTPGIYRMLAKDKTILYIGKATSLKSRVNSYFRGLKNKNRRTMEMLAQVWDIQTVECQSPLEAALLESDEIKKWRPPYNILLKSEDRTLIFYNAEYCEFAESKDEFFCHGPYKPHDALRFLFMLLEALKSNQTISFFQEDVTAELLRVGWDLFCNQYGLIPDLGYYTLRQLLAIANNFLRGFERFHGKGMFETWWLQEKKINPEEDLNQEQRVAQKMARLFLRAAETKRKSRQLMRLFNAKLVISKTKQPLNVVQGIIHWESHTPNHSQASNGAFDVSHYDRLSILLSAKNKKIVAFDR